MGTDPRSSIKTLLDTEITDANLTKDDDTELSWIVVYGPMDVPLTRVFQPPKNIDLIFTISEAERVTTRLGVSHIGEYVVTPHVIDKYDVDGNQIITATLVLWKATEELRSVFKANPWGSLRSLQEERGETENLGSTIIWSKPCRIEYKTYSL